MEGDSIKEGCGAYGNKCVPAAAKSVKALNITLAKQGRVRYNAPVTEA